MAHFQIIGGAPLDGRVRSGGSKNAALPIMAASILASEPVRLLDVPRLADVRIQSRLLGSLGTQVSWADDEMLLETVDDRPIRAPQRLVRRMRAGFCTLGPLLARRGKALVPLPGGCNLGHRPVDLHLKGLAALGAELNLQQGYVVAAARRLHGAEIDLLGPHGPTVTGTANVLSAAVLARGTTVVRNAAVEPEIVDLTEFLIRLGAKIEGVGTPTLRIEGVEQLGGATHRLIPDRIEAATLLIAAAITGGSVEVVGVVPRHLDAVLEKLREAGAEIDVGNDWASIKCQRGQVHVFGRESIGEKRLPAEKCASPPIKLKSVNVIAEPYPGFPTDLQPLWTTLAAVSQGASRIEDRVFPGRFMHAAELNRLGANVSCAAGGEATIMGVEHLSGASVAARDLRGGAALLLAGLAAEGSTTVEGVHHIDRGYQRLDEKLRRLGARIERIAERRRVDAAAKLLAPLDIRAASVDFFGR
ncbi:MAG: UDP-N-acetylglucosamine 1-carboxyvinyltransferase [Pirellulales bacterium]|nr:UDP-N-acetylglucosamine 1-carboxyvinyltransferase [Pirellulales bacterium]